MMKKALLLLTIIVIASACVTKKRRGDVGKLKKFYHDVTAEFNGYFNANELVAFSQIDLENQHQDNFNKILPVYPALAADNPQSEAADLDNAIEKVTRVVALHGVSHWVDDCYVMAGKAQYLKQDFESAEETFEYTVANFDPADVSDDAKTRTQKRKEREKEQEEAREERIKTAKQKRKEYNKMVRKKRREAKKARKNKSQKKKDEKEEEAKAAEEGAEAQNEEMAQEEEVEQPEPQPDNYFMKHRPVFQESQLWLARTYIEREKYTQAELILSRLESDPKLFKDIIPDIAVAKAHLYLKQDKYAQAVFPLEMAVETVKDRKKRARYAYILAQVYQKQNKGGEAYDSYKQVVKWRPGYEMEFSARMNMTLNSYANGQSSSEQAIKDLEKMLKEDKNAEYKDQIYYAMAQIAFKKGDEPLAIEYLELSLRNSTQNPAQKAEAYLQLADLYYDDESYVKAKTYFDSTLMVLPQTDERYNRVQRLSTNLTDIAENINTIALQDSLLEISELTLEEKKALAFELKKKENERRRQQLKSAASGGGSGFSRQPVAARIPGASRPSTASSQSTFFAYDDKRLRRGIRDFQQQWNNRPLEDNWRRSNKKPAAGIGEDELVEEEIASELMTDEQVAVILQDVPQSPDDVAESNKIIQKAYFDLGVLYRDRLQNYEKATEALETLLRRYPDTDHRLDALYYLYLAYSDMGNTTKAQEYYNKIVQDYPETTYARVLQNPNYLKEQGDKEKQLNDYYDQTYALFTSGNYQQTKSRLQQVEQEFGVENKLKSRFALLSAMTVGNLEGREAYVAGLKDVIAQYPNTDEEKRAREILRLLGVGTTGPIRGANTANTGENGEQFKYEEGLHYMLIALNADASLTDAKAAISDFNRKYFKLEKLRITNIYLTPDAKTPVVIIRRYEDKDAAMLYYETVQKNAQDFLPGFEYEMYPVTQGNYREVLRNRSLDGYREFFQANYLK